jgi:hypothetical protein
VRDFANQKLDRGSPVVAGISGKVKYAAGYTVILADDAGIERMQFHHFDKILVKPGQSVSPSTVIGLQGNKPGGDVHVHLDAQPAYHERWIAAQLNAPRSAEYTSDFDTIAAQQTPGGSVTPKTSLLGGGGGEPQDIGTMLEKAFKAFREGFSQPEVAVTPREAGTPAKVQPQPSPDRTKVQKTVQQGSEEFTSREATKAKGGTAVVPIPIPVSQQGVQPQQRIVVNSAGPTAMLS